MMPMILDRYNIPLGSMFGIPIKVNAFLPLFVVFQCLTLLSFGGKAVLWGALVSGPILFISVLINSFGHSFGARSVGGEVSQIILWPLGSLAYFEHYAGPGGDLWVTFVGPLTHIPQAAIWYLIWWSTHTSGSWPRIYDHSDFGGSLVGTAFWLNIYLMVFNLLVPAYPLNGGRILVDLLQLANVPDKVTAWITIVTAVAVSVAMIVMSFVFKSFGFGGILIALFILYSTFGLWQYLDKGQIEQHPLFRKASDQSENPAADLEVSPKNDGSTAADAQV